MTKLCFGVGVAGNGDRKSPIFHKWYDMIRRVYSERYTSKYPTYKNVGVFEVWLYFENFKEWATSLYFKDCVLDKDILSGGDKTYSPETCCFIPERINLLFMSRSSKVGLPLGVTVDPRKKEGTRRFVARVGDSVGKQNRHLGMFLTPESAHKAWQIGKCVRITEELGWWKEQESFNPLVADRIMYYHDRLLSSSQQGVLSKSALDP